MSHSLPDDARKCGRCSWWDGSRRITDGAHNLVIESKEGRCANSKATPGMANCKTEFISGCHAFEVWNRLR